MNYIFVFLYVLLLFPESAYAYLDPGSSSALLSTLIAALAAGLYSFKSIYYRVVKKEQGPEQLKFDDTLLIFSEGQNYWGTFRPLVNELIKQKVRFRYITLDLHDPALKINSIYMQSRLYSKGPSGFGKLAAVKAPLMLSTTPNIGSKGYPMQRSPNVENLMHVFHALSDTSHYRLGALDHYDSVIMVGEHERGKLRHVEVSRNIKKKELVALGLPYLDDLYAQISQRQTFESSQKTILIAPSWGRKGCFAEYGIGFVHELVDSGFNVIIRPHPQSYISEPDLVEKWKRVTSNVPNIHWDSNVFSSKSMQESDILISDTSSVRFDYAFLYSKPVITLDIPKEKRDEFESFYHEKIWAEEVSTRLGVVVNKLNIHELPEIVKDILESFSMEEIKTFRDSTVTNFGCSAPAIVDFIVNKISQMDKAGV